MSRPSTPAPRARARTTVRERDRTLFRGELLAWYRQGRRDLPWRTSRDPYRIWVSEILLQQTRVDAALPYYRRFIERFPTVDHLAEAPLDRVLEAWQGLGYYGRARNLHRAAKAVRARFAGCLPEDPVLLRTLPGIGPYTAAAIASIAYGADVPVVDGNVIRVLCRFFTIADDPALPATRTRLEGIASRLLPPGEAGDFNQAVMELGALTCKPARPDCSTCPLAPGCRAHRANRTHRYPSRTPRAPLPVRTRAVLVLAWRGRLLFEQRPTEGLLGGLWELPGTDLGPRQSLRSALSSLRSRLAHRAEVKTVDDREALRLRHTYSHFHQDLVVVQASGRPGRAPGRAPRSADTNRPCRWLHPNHLSRYALTGATRKILSTISGPETVTPEGPH